MRDLLKHYQTPIIFRISYYRSHGLNYTSHYFSFRFKKNPSSRRRISWTFLHLIVFQNISFLSGPAEIEYAALSSNQFLEAYCCLIRNSFRSILFLVFSQATLILFCSYPFQCLQPEYESTVPLCSHFHLLIFLFFLCV